MNNLQLNFLPVWLQRQPVITEPKKFNKTFQYRYILLKKNEEIWINQK